MRLKLTVAYDGTAYEGWQAQESSRQPLTIQGELEKAFLRLTGGHALRVTGAGRTDSGVHALGQVAHVDIPDLKRDWRHALNSLLPSDIQLLKAEPAPSRFHAQNDAIAKTYIYHFWHESGFIPPTLRNYVWPCGSIDVPAMESALPLFLGEHDFASFRNAGSRVKTTVRTILNITLQEQPAPCLPQHLSVLQLSITGTGFLKQMVRNIAGFLVAVGKHKLQPAALPAILAAKDRRMLKSATAPAKGLFLAHVQYPVDFAIVWSL